MTTERSYNSSGQRPSMPGPIDYGDALAAAVALDDAIERQVTYRELSRASAHVVGLLRRVHARLVSKGAF